MNVTKLTKTPTPRRLSSYYWIACFICLILGGSQSVLAGNYGVNLLDNPDAEAGDMSAWTIDANGGDGWLVAGGYVRSGTQSFATSHQWDTRHQTIDLIAKGFTTAELDAQPIITFSEYVAPRPDAGAEYFIQVDLLDASMQIMASWNQGSQASPITVTAGGSWIQAGSSFSGYGAGVRYVRFSDGGKDTVGWGGNYGAHFDDASVVLSVSPPIVTSIERLTPLTADNDITVVSNVTYHVTFNKAVTGVTSSSFELTTIAGSAAGSIDSVSTNGDGSAYDVVVNSITGAGLLRLDLTAASGVTDEALTPVPAYTGGQTYSFFQPVTVTLSSLAQVYDGQPKSITVSTSPEINVDVTYNGESSAPMNAGSYTVEATVNLPFYVGSSSGTLEVAKATVTVSGLTADKSYDGNTGGIVNTTSATLDGVIGSDEVSINASGATVLFDGSSVGSHNVTISGLALAGSAAGNYSLTQPVTISATIAPLQGVIAEGGVVPASGPYTGGFPVAINGQNLCVDNDITNVMLNGVVVSEIISASPTQVVVAAAAAVPGTGDVRLYSTSFGETVSSNAFTYLKLDQTINFAALPDQLTTNAVDLVADASSGLSVSFAVVSGPGVITDGSHLTFTGSGVVEIEASQVGNENYNAATPVTQSINVLKTPAAIALANLAQTYNGNARTVSAATEPSGLAVNLTYNGSSDAPINAGSYTVEASVDDQLYVGSASDSLEVAKATVTVSGLTADKSYDGNTGGIVNTTSATLDGVIGSDEVSINASGATVLFDGSSVGSHNVTISGLALSGSAAANYSLTQPVTISATIAPLQGVIAEGGVVPASGPYTGGFSVTINGQNLCVDNDITNVTLDGVVVSEIVSASPTQVVVTAAAAVPGTGDVRLYSTSFGETVSSNAFTYLKLDQTINFAALPDQLTTNAVDLVADASSGLAVSFAVVSGPGVITDGSHLTFTASGVVDIEASQAGNENYNAATSVTQSVNVLKTPATIALANLAQTYNGNARTVSATTEPSGLAVNLTYNGSSTAPINAGTYPIVATIDDVMYAGTASDSLAVAKATLTATADNKSWPYGYTNPVFTVSYTGFIGGDNAGSAISVAPTASITATQPGGILTNKFGSYPISVSGGSSPNYSFNYVSGTLTVSKAPLTITVAATNRPYGQPNPALSSSIVGVVGNDNITINPTTTATQSSVPGTYTINVPVTDPLGKLGWYSISWQVGTLTVTPASLVGTVQSQTRAYGQANAPFEVIYSGWVLGQNESLLGGNLVYTCVDGGSTAVDATTVVGAYAIHAAGQTAPNYTVSYQDGTLTIAPAVLNVVAQDAQRLYGEPNPQFSASFSGFANGETTASLSGALSLTSEANTNSPVGQYDILASGLTSPNYQIEFTKGTLSVNPAPLIVSADDASKVYGSALPELSGSLSGIVNGENISATFHTDATESSPVATYTIYPSFADPGSTLANYQITTNEGTLTITPAELTVTADAQIRSYGETNPIFTATLSGFVNGDATDVVSGQPVLTSVAETNCDVGVYEIAVDVSALSAANYTFTPASGSLTVTQAVLLVTADDQSRLYGAANPTLTTTITGFLNEDAVDVVAGEALLETTATESSVVGTYPITVDVSGMSAQNYSFIGSNGTLTVGQAILVVSANPQERSYGAANPELTWSYSGFIPGDDASVLTGTPETSTSADTNSPVGDYDITIAAGSLQATNYVLEFSNSTLTVSRAELVVKAADQSRTYGAENPELAIVYAGFVNGETESVLDSQPTASTLADATSPVNDYEIAVSGGGASNYELVSISGTLSVTPAALTIQADNLSRTYGAANPEPVLLYSGFVNGENSSVLLEQPAVTIAADALSSANATYPIQLSGGSAANYSITLIDGSLSVTPAIVTATADSQQRTYGAQNPTFTIVYAGFMNGEDETVLTSPAVASSTADAASPANQSYDISVSGGAAQNYQIVPVNGTLTVTPALLTVKADDVSKVYGATNPVLTTTITGFVNEEQLDVVSGSAELATPAEVTSAVGTYPITAGAGTLAAQNYTFQLVDGSLNIDKAALLVQADPKSRLYGETNPVFTATITGFVNDDTTAVVTGAPVLETAATLTSPTGQYDITVATGDLDAANYSFVTSNGVLTIAQAMLTVVADDQQRMYGQANPSLTYHFEPALSDSSLVKGEPSLSTTADASSTVAGYPITIAQGTLASTEYAFTFQNGSLAVTQAVLTITVNNAERVYGDSNPELTGSSVGLANEDPIAISFSSSALATDPVGQYDIVPALDDQNGRLANYVVVTNLGALTITPAALTVWADDLTKVYGEANPAFTGTNSALVAGDDITITYVAEVADRSNVGNYSIVPDFADPANRLGNYTVTARNGTLQITPRPLLVTANDAARPYGQANPEFSMSFNGFASGDDVTSLATPPTAACSADSTYWLGTYPIVASGGVSENYAFTYVNGTLTIGKAPLTISGPSVSRAYGSANPVIVASIVGLVNGDVITASYTSMATPSDPPGVYGIMLDDLQDDLGVLGAYDVTLLGGTLTVTNASLIGQVGNASKVYGSANPSFEVTYSGFVNGENESLITGSVSFLTSADTNTAVGAYPIHVTSGQQARYYDITYLDGTLTVTPATLTVAADPKSRLYGETNPVLTATITGFLNNDSAEVVSGAPELSTTAAVESPIGQYDITVLPGSLSSANYLFATTNGTLTVAPNLLVVIADDQSRTYGATNPVLTYHFSGLQAGDTADSISGTPAISTSADTNSPVTNYVISINVGTLASANYAFAFTSGTLSVTPAVLTATADDQSRPYGSENPELTITYSGFVNDETSADLESQPAANTLADSISPVINGGYPISLSGGSDRNYNIQLVNGTLTVTKVTLVASVPDQTRLYGGSNPSLGVNFSGFVNGENEAALDAVPLATTSATEASPVGEYPVVVSGGSDNNYEITTENGTLTVLPAPLTLSAPTLTRVYGAENPALEISYSGFVNGETAAVLEGQPTIATPATVTSSIGEYPITITGGSAANYDITRIDGSLTINPAPLSVVAADASRAFGVENPTFTGVLTGLLNSDPITVSYDCSATPESPVGTYPIVPSLSASPEVLGNYSVASVNGTLTVLGGLTLSTNAGLYTVGQPAVLIDTNAAFGDGGSIDFSNATLTVTIVSNAVADDVLAVLSGNGDQQAHVIGSIVFYNGSLIGTWTGGEGTQALVLTLNANASSAAITAFMRQLTFATENTHTASREFQFTISYGSTTVSASRSFVLNRPPVAGDLEITAAEGIAIEIPLSQLLAQASDLDQDTITVTATSWISAYGGSITSSAGKIIYHPPVGHVGEDLFGYLIEDGRGGQDIGLVVINSVTANRLQLDMSDVANSGAKLTMGGTPGRSYVIEASTDLTNWTTIGTVTANANGLIQVLDSEAQNHPSRFYRAVGQ